MIIFKEVIKKFGGRLALNKVSFTVGKGEIVGLLGPNGAGKTTTMRMIVGLLKPSSGQVNVAGLDVEKQRLDVCQKVGYLAENNPLYDDFKAGEYLKFIGRVREIDLTANLNRVVEDCGLTEVLSQKIEQLSKGFKQRLGLAAALLGNPEILILDEPTIGLDPNQIIEIRRLIKNLSRKKTVILSTHILPEVQAVCQKAIIIHRGKIVAEGSLKKLTRGRNLEKLFQKLTL